MVHSPRPMSRFTPTCLVWLSPRRSCVKCVYCGDGKTTLERLGCPAFYFRSKKMWRECLAVETKGKSLWSKYTPFCGASHSVISRFLACLLGNPPFKLFRSNLSFWSNLSPMPSCKVFPTGSLVSRRLLRKQAIQLCKTDHCYSPDLSTESISNFSLN